MSAAAPQPAGENLPQPPWLAENARLTAFTLGAAGSPKQWKSVFGAEPDQIAMHPGAPKIEGGLIDGARWMLSQQPGRVDIIVGPDIPPIPPGDLITVGGFIEVVDALLSTAEAFLPEPPITRVAFGIVLIRPVGQLGRALLFSSKLLRY